MYLGSGVVLGPLADAALPRQALLGGQDGDGDHHHPSSCTQLGWKMGKVSRDFLSYIFKNFTVFLGRINEKL